MFPMSFRNRDAYHVPNCECACDNRAGALFIQDEKKRRGARAERENDREIWDTVDAGGGGWGEREKTNPMQSPLLGPNFRATYSHLVLNAGTVIPTIDVSRDDDPTRDYLAGIDSGRGVVVVPPPGAGQRQHRYAMRIMRPHGGERRDRTGRSHRRRRRRRSRRGDRDARRDDDDSGERRRRGGGPMPRNGGGGDDGGGSATMGRAGRDGEAERDLEVVG